MSSAEFADDATGLDRLADFVAGVLDGTPEADEVRRLIATDDAWSAAYTDLLAAEVSVRADLAALGAQPTPMPRDVAERLDQLLDTPLVLDHHGPVAAVGGLDGGRRPAGRTDPARPAARSDGGRPAGRRRHARLVAGLSAAAAVVAVGLGLLALAPQMNNSDSSTSARAPMVSDGDAGGAAKAPPPSNATVTVSGRDYRVGDFGSLVLVRPNAVAGSGATDSSNKAAPGVEGNRGVQGETAFVPPELQRLADPAARADCLGAILARHGGTVRIVDYARFTGNAALIVLLSGSRTGSGADWVVIAGPACGLPAGQVDERYNGPVS